MSVALMSGGDGIAEIAGALSGEADFPGSMVRRDEDCGSSCSSSIGRNSDLSGGSLGSVDDGEAEVQSSYKGPLQTMDALEDSLPMRRGISQFYGGKSKSFTSLGDVSSAAKDLAKPDNPYNRKRKNLLATSMMFNRNEKFPLRRSTSNIRKRLADSSRNDMSFASSRSSSGSITSEESQLPRLPPLHPGGKHLHSDASPPQQWSFASRSISLVDLHDSASISSKKD